jgi:hypothetical protein
MQLKQRLLTGASPHEEGSPLESLILTQYEPTNCTGISSNKEKEKCTNSVVSYECNNEDLVHGGYGFEKEGWDNSSSSMISPDVDYDIDNWNLFGS